jgi:hypothetical protein
MEALVRGRLTVHFSKKTGKAGSEWSTGQISVWQFFPDLLEPCIASVFRFCRFMSGSSLVQSVLAAACSRSVRNTLLWKGTSSSGGEPRTDERRSGGAGSGKK